MYSKLELDDKQFNPNTPNAQANRSKKLNGSFGVTTVIPMPEGIDGAIRGLLEELIHRMELTPVQPQKINTKNHFVNQSNQQQDDKPMIIAPIQKLHTTIVSWQVMDAENEPQWQNELFRSRLCANMARNSFDVFNDVNRKLLYDLDTNSSVVAYQDRVTKKLEQMIDDGDFVGKEDLVEKLVKQSFQTSQQSYEDTIDSDKIQPFMLDAASIKINNDGNIVIQWKTSEDLKSFRQELSKQGGLAKWGPNVATTLAYFPNWDKMTTEERDEVRNNLKDIITNNYAELGLNELEHMQVEPEQLQQVIFSRNDLSPDSANWADAVAVFERDKTLNSDCLKVLSFQEVSQKFDNRVSPSAESTVTLSQ